MLVVGAVAGWLASPARPGWKLGNFFLVGVSSASNSALYRTNASLYRTAANTAVIPLSVGTRGREDWLRMAAATPVGRSR